MYNTPTSPIRRTMYIDNVACCRCGRMWIPTLERYTLCKNTDKNFAQVAILYVPSYERLADWSSPYVNQDFEPIHETGRLGYAVYRRTISTHGVLDAKGFEKGLYCILIITINIRLIWISYQVNYRNEVPCKITECTPRQMGNVYYRVWGIVL